MTFLRDLEPESLWRHFDEILKVPRRSKNEEKIREYVVGVAERLGLECLTDSAGNVVVKKPATAGKQSAPGAVIQAHLDMVEEKNSDVQHDFTKDPIVPQWDGDYVKATGTTLGADCGIGMASMLALMEADDLAHGPLEMLFTVDEETGLTGAAALASDLLDGRILLNVDSEEEGVLTIGCAGGGDDHLFLPVTRSPLPGDAAGIAVRLSGLKGGHSGVDAHLQRGNAIKLVVRALYAVSLDRPLRVAALAGGNAHNAIPREATATISVAATDREAVKAALEKEFASASKEFRPAEPGMEWSIDDAPAPGDAWDDATTATALRLIHSLPHGVISMSYDIPGLVETSTNLAVVAESDGRLAVLLSSRSSVESALTALRHRIRATGLLVGTAVEEHDSYPGWQPDVSSPLLETVKKVHMDVVGSEAEVGAIHAGLECGIIGEKYAGMDMISFGPQIEFPHSPDERVKVPSVATFYKLLTTTLERLAAG
jgi:dipeptidase D